ncbi:MAG: hypothetical protein Q9160_004245 [Pyrenula sp. 1 TL-2023]
MNRLRLIRVPWSTPLVDPETNLREMLHDKYEKNLNYKKQKYLGLPAIKQVLTHENVERWIASHPLHRKRESISHPEDLIVKLLDDAVLLLAILIFKELEYLAFSFLESGIDDNCLFKDALVNNFMNAEEQKTFEEGLRMVGLVLQKDEHRYITQDALLPFNSREDRKGGSFGTVYRVEIASGHLQGSRETVIAEKVIHLNSSTKEALDVAYREVETMRQRTHPNIVPLLASYTLTRESSRADLRSLHLIEPYAEEDLADWMNKMHAPAWIQGKTQVERLMFLYDSIFGLVSGLSFLHRANNGLITAHHDLKPRNILVIGEELMIADFGRSHLRPLIGGSETSGATGLGTYEYHPPEYWQENGQRTPIKHGRAFDFWSMGCIILELATLFLYGWENNKVADFRTRRSNATPSKPQLATKHPGDSSFHNHWDAVSDWINHLETHDNSSRKFKAVLDLARGLMALNPSSRVYAWEAELDMFNLREPDANRKSRLDKGALCVQPPPLAKSGEIRLPEGAETPVHRASRKMDKERVQQLLKAGWPSLQTFGSPKLRSILPQATRDLPSPMISPDPISPSRMSRAELDSSRELLRAAENGDTERVQSLLDSGVKLMLVDEHGRSALYIAVANGRKGTVGLLLKVGAMHLLNMAEKRLEQGEWGDTPLHKAASLGHVKILEELLAYRPDLESRQKEGKTPLFLAIEWGRLKIVQILLRHGSQAFTQRTDTHGTTLHAAVKDEPGPFSEDRMEILNLLLAQGGAHQCLEQRNIHGDTPFYLAVVRSKTAYARVLYEAGASVHTCNKDNVNVLHFIADNGLHELLRDIMHEFSGSELTARNLWGHTPMDIAQRKGNDTVYKILKDLLAER